MKKQYFLRGIILSLFMSFVSFNSFSQERKFKMSDYGILPNQQVSIASKLATAIQDIKEKQAEGETAVLVFEKGIYYFDATNSPKKVVYISNHDQVGRRSIGMLIDGMKNVVVEGNGADFRYRGRMLPVAVLNSTNVELKDFSIDFENPMMAQVEVVKNTGHSITFRPAPWVKWRIKNNKFEYYGTGWSYAPWLGIAFDGDSYNMLYDTADIGVDTDGAIDNNDGTVTAPNWANSKLIVGSRLAIRTGDKQCPGIFLQKNKDTKLTGVTVHYSQAMALLAHACENVTLDRTSVKIREGSGRYITSQADATHFSCCRGKITVKNGLFESMMDDALNVHGLYLLVDKRIDDNTIVGRYPEVQSWGFEWALKGEKVQFIKSNTFDKLGTEYTIKSIQPKDRSTVLGAKKFTITFEEKLPKEVNGNHKVGVENITRTAEVEYLNNTVRNNRARGILLNTSKHILVEGNTFDHVSGSAILSSTDCNGWYESGQTQDLVIRNNKFIDCLTTNGFQFCEAIISLYPVIPDKDAQKKPFYGNSEKAGIIIENNLFQTFDTPLLSAISSDGILWKKNNTVKPTNTYPKNHPNQSRFKFENCGKNITIEREGYEENEYEVWDDYVYGRHRKDRVVKSLSVEGATLNSEKVKFKTIVAGENATEQSKIVFNNTLDTLNVSLEDKLVFVPKTDGFTWMHYYVFIDYNQNKKFDEDEVVSYTAFQAPEDVASDTYRNSLGKKVSPGATPKKMPVFTIPKSAKLGATRVRFKVDWNSKDPKGSSNPEDPIDRNGGTICDFTMNIHNRSTGVVNPKENTDVKVYPNPATDFVLIEGLDIKETVSLYSINGVFIKNYEASNLGHLRISVKDLPTGVYLLHNPKKSVKIQVKH